MVSTVKLYMLVPVSPKVKKKTNHWNYYYMKANSCILMRLEIAGMAQNKQKCLPFIVVLKLE